MSTNARSTSTVDDLTHKRPELKHPIVRGSESNFPSRPIDLTTPHDHMHAVVDMLRPTRRAIGLPETSPNPSKKRKLDFDDSPSRHRKSHATALQNSGIPPLSPHTDQDQALHEAPHISSRNSASSLFSSPTQQSKPASFNLQNYPTSQRKTFKVFPFMDFPPEIRNNIYRMLLTTCPIELPELTGRNGASHRARWAKCITAKQKKQHKTIFLEILACSKQIHDEASGILYGSNIFKYRSMPGESTKQVVLPTRHLQLLKHIKISVISGVPHPRQDQSVANLVRQFVKDGLKLETFEFTWFGQARYHLRKDSDVCQALRILDVQNSFSVKVGGLARMEKRMQDDLETILQSRKVEIHRPVKAVTGEELSDAEGT